MMEIIIISFFQVKKEKNDENILDDNDYEFDAFVSYSSSDSDCVKKYLPQFETKNNLKFCFEEREWLPGYDRALSLQESIENSRKILIIVSNAFAISEWCYFQLSTIQAALFEKGRDNVILVMLEDIAEENLNPRLRFQIQRRSYVEWSSNCVVGRQLFFAKLKRALTAPSSSIVKSPLENIRLIDFAR